MTTANKLSGFTAQNTQNTQNTLENKLIERFPFDKYCPLVGINAGILIMLSSIG